MKKADRAIRVEDWERATEVSLTRAFRLCV